MEHRIKELRKYLGMTTESFGKKIGIAASTVTNVEAGRRKPTNQLITSICREYNVNEQWLRTGEGTMFAESPEDERIASVCDRPHGASLLAKLSALSDAGLKALDDLLDSLEK